MRLVSAIYNYYHPFDAIDKVTSFYPASEPEELAKDDILVVWGGADIHPELYNRGRSSHSGAGDAPSRRDKIEWALMQRARELQLPIIGVCRGAQMLCALAGGILIQHVNNHFTSHMVTTVDGKQFKTNSIHHQMMFPKDTNHNVVAWSTRLLSDVYYDVDKEIEVDQEPEFIYFPDVRGFAIQWHPEATEYHDPSTIYVNNFISAHL